MLSPVKNWPVSIKPVTNQAGTGPSQCRGPSSSSRQLIAGNRPQEIAQAKNTYLATQSEAKQAYKTYERLKALLPKKLASQEDVDNAEAKAKALRHQEKATYEAWQVAILGARDEDIAQVRAQIAQAEAEVKLAEKTSPIPSYFPH